MRGRTYGVFRTALCAAGLAAFSIGCYNPPTTREAQRVMVQEGFGRIYESDSTDQEIVAPRDVIQIQSANYQELNLSVQVGPDGRIAVPYIGDVKVAGMTRNEIRETLTDLLSVYMKQLDLVVLPEIRASQRVFVTGAVKKGGVLALTGDMTVWDAMFRTGAHEFGDKTAIRVIRADPKNPQIFKFNLTEMEKYGYSEGNIQLKNDDIVYVPFTIWGQLNETLDYVLTPVKIVLGASSTLLRGFLLPSAFEGIDEIADQISSGRLRGIQGKGGGAVFF